MIEIDCVVDSASLLGEATYWDPKAQVLVVDRHLGADDPPLSTRRPARTTPGRRPNISGRSRLREKGGLVVSMVSGFYFFDPEDRARSRPIVDPEADIADTRFNDGKTDRQGRFWSGTMFEAPGNAGEDRRALAARHGPLGRTR